MGFSKSKKLVTQGVTLLKLSDHHYIDSLIESCIAAKEARPVNRYLVKSLFDLENLVDIGSSIYIIREIEGDSDKTFSSFSAYKSKQERACAKLNAPSDVLYVGSSTTGVKNRLKQHLIEGPKGTYALHMKHWFSGNYNVEVLEFRIPIDVLQIIEDSISFNLKPAFGKQGGNNKYRR